jgi:DNA polymerase
VEAEIAAVQPRVIVCLGATAAQSVLGRAVRIGEERGRVTQRPTGESVVVTYHPSAALRMPDEAARAEITQALARDLADATI